MATFKSKQYSWSDITIVLGGRILEGVVDVEYTAKKEKDFLRGRGNKPQGILHGNYDYSGKIEIWQSELESMIKTAPDNDILNISFDVIVSYVPEGGGVTVIDILKGVELTEFTKGMKQGDKNKTISLPIIFLDVKPQQ